jgi:hypothetical protein
MDWEDSLHLSRQKGNTVRTWSSLWQLRADRVQPFGLRETLSVRGLNMETREARYGKTVAQKTIWTLNGCLEKLETDSI